MKDKFGDHGRLRRCITAGLSAVFMGSLAVGCSGANKPVAEETAEPLSVPETADPVPTLEVAALGRAELLAAASAAADEAAAGKPMPVANTALVDRNFELRLPFGCDGPGSDADRGEWSFDPESRVLRVSVKPQIWNNDQTFKALAADLAYDAAEGFWIGRPWTRSEECPPPVPAKPAPATPQPPAGAIQVSPTHTFALVQYFPPDAPRTLRRGQRPYAYTGRVPEGIALGAKGYRLKLIGRISGFSDGQPIHCAVTSPMLAPTCAAAIELNQVAIEDAETGKSLAQWGS